MLQGNRVETRKTAGFARVGQSLAARRTWLSDEDAQNKLDAWVAGLPAEHQDGARAVVSALRDVRQESKQRREKLAEFETAQQKREKEQAEAEAAKLLKQGEFEALAKKNADERDALLPFKQQAEQYQTLLTSLLDTRKKNLPPHIADLVSKLSVVDALAWLDANADKLNTPAAPNGDGDKRGAKTPPTPNHKEMQGRSRSSF